MTGNSNKAVLLLSAGLDSAVNLALAKKELSVMLALTMNYGQRAAVQEIKHAEKLAAYYEVPHKIIDLPWLKELSPVSLTDEKAPLPEVKDLDKGGRARAQAVWVPNRNGLFINIAACFAENLGAGRILFGGNLEEAKHFPDNSPEFMLAANKFFKLSTWGKAELFSFTLYWHKDRIADEAVKSGVPLDLIWSCYRGEKKMCGQCESCMRLVRGMKNAGHGHRLGDLNMREAV